MRNGLLLVAFLFAFGNTAFALGAKDYVEALISGIIAAACVITGIASSRD